MTSRTVILILCFVFGAVPMTEAEEDARSGRGPIVYDSRWEVHHVDPGIRVPGDEAVDGSHARTAPASAGYQGDIRVPQWSAPAFIPPPQAARPSQEDGRRNWILPTLDDDTASFGSGTEEQEESSGWGWLADEVEQRQRMREDEAREINERREEAESDWMLQRELARPGSLMDGPLTAAPLLFESRDDETEDRSAERALPAGSAAGSPLDEGPFEDAGNRNAVTSEDPYGAVDPWNENEQRASAWEMDTSPSREVQWADAFDTYGSDRNDDVGYRSEIAAPDFSSWTEDVTPAVSEPRFVDSSAAGSSIFGSGTYREETTASIESPFGGMDAGGSFGSFDGAEGGGFAPVDNAGSRWSGDWSGDSGWQGGRSEPSRSPGLTVPSQTPSGSLHHNGWLADPDR